LYDSGHIGSSVRVDEGKRVLEGAIVQVGGVKALAAHLRISERIVRHYLVGHEPIPEPLLMKLVDVIIQHLPENSGTTRRSAP